ncbi:hypothetical protein [Spiribacter onubensis]|uniref:hypothetical protein n=1 Tax=Spiribacter onubensis TaxID=3122420 RepID=UPI00349F60B8
MQAQRFLDAWAAGRAPATERGLEFAITAADREVRFFPGPSGTAFDRAASARDWFDPQTPFARATEAVIASRRAAVDAYEAAVDARPLWPYGHLRLAAALTRVEWQPARFSEALARGFELGPWRPRVTRRVVELGLPRWGWLDGEARRAVLLSARRTASLNPQSARAVRQIAERSGQRELLRLAIPALYDGRVQ